MHNHQIVSMAKTPSPKAATPKCCCCCCRHPRLSGHRKQNEYRSAQTIEFFFFVFHGFNARRIRREVPLPAWLGPRKKKLRANFVVRVKLLQFLFFYSCGGHLSLSLWRTLPSFPSQNNAPFLMGNPAYINLCRRVECFFFYPLRNRGLTHEKKTFDEK